MLPHKLWYNRGSGLQEVFSRRRHVTAALLIGLLGAIVSGCQWQSGVKDDMQEYRARLARVLDVAFPAPASAVSLTLPANALLTRPVERMNVNLRDFYQLQQCELGTLVAQRNTALGKTAQPSQRFIYETRLLRQLAACRKVIDKSNPTLSHQLEQWLAAKQRQRPILWANLIQTSPELRAGLSRGASYIEPTTNDSASATLAALGFLQGIKQTPQRALTSLEQQLKAIDSNRLPARVWRTQYEIARQLNALNSTLAKHLPALACPNEKASEQVTILHNVFSLFFINKIQPVGSKLNQYHYHMLPVWQQWQHDPDLHPAFKAFLQQHAQVGFANYQRAIKDHVTLWQTLFARCNLSPAPPP